MTSLGRAATPVNVLERLGATHPTDLLFDAIAIDEGASPELIGKPRQLLYFRKAYDFDGMAPEAFASFGAFAATATEFAAATRKTVDFVARVVEARQSRAA